MNKDPIRFAFVGDVCLSFFDRIQAGVPQFPNWLEIEGEIGGHDFLVGNLECCLVDETCAEAAWDQKMAVPATACEFLRNLGFTDLCLANNHALDCGPGAVAVTRRALAASGIRGFGLGSNLREAEEPIFVQRNGCEVAFLGACDRSDYYASDGSPGIAPLEKRRLGERVRAAAARADLVVVTLHSDLEFCEVPGAWRQRLSRWLVNQGAHLVIQHHPHVLQGIETYRGGVIAYSLGNFIFRLRGNQYQERHAEVFDSFVLIVDVNRTAGSLQLSHRVVPLRIGEDHLPRLVTGPSREESLRRVAVISSLVIQRKAHRSAWFRRCRSEANARISNIYYAFRRRGMANGNSAIWNLLRCREDRRWILGLLSLGYL